MKNSTFVLTGNLKANLIGLPIKQMAAIRAAAEYTAPQAEAYMRQNALWTDRTGNARNGLRARVYAEGDTIAIVMHHSVPYGIYLEVRWGGKYAIIAPTIQAIKPVFIGNVKRLLFKG